AVVESLQYLPDFQCDVLHCNDWHTALAPVFLREFYHGPLYDNVKTVFTVHNIKFQGIYPDHTLGDVLGLDHIPAAVDQLRFDWQIINYMKGALCYSDVLTTVSPTYVDELKNPFYGERLDGLFRWREDRLHGILNGIDTEMYDPAADKGIAANYSVDDPSGKAACKAALQRELGLWEDADVPVVAMIGRLTEQKGLDLVQRVLDELMDKGLQMVVLGTGDRQYEDMLRYYAWKYPGRLYAGICFDEALSHRIYAGADMLLMPSLFEPCGLSQMIAMRYGTLPVVRETGGLKDSVTPYNQYTGEGTGFSFANYNAHEMMFTLLRAAELFREDRESWNKLVGNAMAADFSWGRAAERYLELYKQARS
ncbi:MAG: glycogen synthase, partial [Oscillospiraceae bacterium]|nr:glycogen synthase [Oscillospiraceae bacterium]